MLATALQDAIDMETDESFPTIDEGKIISIISITPICIKSNCCGKFLHNNFPQQFPNVTNNMKNLRQISFIDQLYELSIGCNGLGSHDKNDGYSTDRYEDDNIVPGKFFQTWL